MITDDEQLYKEWFNLNFDTSEKQALLDIGIECKADHKYFKYEILDIYDFLRNYKLRKLPNLYDKILDRFIKLNPVHVRSQIDRNRLSSDEYYSAWFVNRFCFFNALGEAKKRLNVVLLWAPLIDTNTPSECHQYLNKIFNIDDSFLEQAILHWQSPNRGCRCSLLTIRRDQLIKNPDLNFWI
ncbi:hypothetical protein KTH44_09660 [Acinetobacter bereziniae]|uniref:hypothetical protein n=1 Tax=Acinetobacter bereziniae TaxID=106648 RepID=UPI0021CD7FC7|nr:hypothetical protein [Acinetobacter bereziniae]MCU4319393.1 hypothetical protein [Acinetobacter bereziniae]